MAINHATVVGPKVRGLFLAFVLVVGVNLAGRTLEPPDLRTLGPSRIISLVPAVTEMLFAIGAGNEVVGVSSYDTFPPEVTSKARVGALIDPDVERILSLKPDLVVVYNSQTELMTRLDRVRIPTFRYEHAGLADITSTIRSLGQRLERGAQAEAVASRIERDLEAIRRSVAGKRRPRIALLFEREPGTLRNIYASGGIGFMHDMLETAGGEDVFADIKRQSVQATAELLLTRAPDIIIEVHTFDRWPEDRIARERAVWKALPSLPAVRSGRIYLLQDERLAIPGPRVAEAVKLLADILHPAGQPDYQANSRAILAGTSPLSKDSVKKRSSAALPRLP